ncbi:hypothetical protein [Pyxidicoccus parkwayensis]|nr:hypothetical protein [Pyxidicoccus parkwaysis]
MFHEGGFPFESVDDAWLHAEHLYPLLGWLTASFPDAHAFQTCAEWLRLCAARIEGSEPSAVLFAQARSDAPPRQAHIVASRLGDVRNEHILARKPAAAAFADAASHLAEAWAAITTQEVESEDEPWARAKAAAAAMVTAWVYQRGLGDEDKEARKQARVELTRMLRSAHAGLQGR